SNRKRLARMRRSSRRSWGGGRPWLEALEDRTVLATLPAPIIPYGGHQFLPAGGLTNDNTPRLAVDPIDPSKVVAVYQSTTTAAGASLVAAAFSANYGRTWSFLGVMPSIANPANGNPFLQATDPSVAFDRN